MAFVEIPEEPLRKFLKLKTVFAKIGDTFDAIYLSDAPNKEPERFGQDFCWAIEGCPAVVISIKGALKVQLDKAKREGHLIPGARVRIQLAKLVDTGKENKMRSFKVACDPAYKGAPPKNGPNVSFDRPADSGESDSNIPF